MGDSASGFWTQVRYDVPVLTVVWNNLNYQTVRHAYHNYSGRMAKSGHYAGMYLGDPNIDFARLAESQGVNGEKVEDAGALEAALHRGIAATREGKPYLVEVAIARPVRQDAIGNRPSRRVRAPGAPSQDPHRSRLRGRPRAQDGARSAFGGHRARTSAAGSTA